MRYVFGRGMARQPQELGVGSTVSAAAEIESVANRLVLATMVLLALAIMTGPTHAASKETVRLVDVGGYHLNFRDTRGSAHGAVIVFESGGGDDSAVWDTVIDPIREATGARIIRYDRAGYGHSDPAPGPYTVDSEVLALRRALDSLHVSSCVMFVAHSYGGFITTLYAAQNPARVCGAVLIDADLVAFFSDAEVERLMAGYREERGEIAEHNPTLVKVLDSFPATVRRLREVTFPESIPVIDIVSARPPVHSDLEIEDWRRVHRAFVEAAPTRRGTSAASGHFVMRDSPREVTDAVVQLYKQLDRVLEH